MTGPDIRGQETKPGPPLTTRAGLSALRPGSRSQAEGRLTVTDASGVTGIARRRSAEVEGRVLRPPGLDDLGFGPLHPFRLLLLLVLLLALAHVHHDAGRGGGRRVQLVLLPWRESGASHSGQSGRASAGTSVRVARPRFCAGEGDTPRTGLASRQEEPRAGSPPPLRGLLSPRKAPSPAEGGQVPWLSRSQPGRLELSERHQGLGWGRAAGRVSRSRATWATALLTNPPTYPSGATPRCGVGLRLQNLCHLVGGKAQPD